MGKSQKKTGKGRLDKYYKLAKEQGYRARSAFKLIQLNKKFSFLESARCCIDLCAAPGSWLQVANKYMPVGSLIVGVDLVPIKPIPRVITFAADITTPQCRTTLRSHLKDWHADIVLHDGAPNVGTAWIQDAYTQSELVLSSLKLATEFLTRGGTFITKVFRSQDYNNLLWVFGQLFGKVEATKPPSSRNVSAEIFVVCTGFLAPAHIDPKFLDPKHVFKDVSSLPPAPSISGAPSNAMTPAAVNVFQPGKKRRHRDGYEDGDYTLFKSKPVSEFIRSSDPITILGTINKMEFVSEEEKSWLKSDATTADVKANLDDLKVLGKGDFKALLKWRTAIREEIGLESKTKAAEELTETVEITEPVDEEQEIQDELERLNADAQARARRDRRRLNEKKQKTVIRMQLRMTAPMDIGMEFGDAQLGGGKGGEDVFDLGEVEKKGARMKLDHGNEDASDSDEEPTSKRHRTQDTRESDLDSEDEREAKADYLERELDGLYDQYRERMSERDKKWKVRESRMKDAKREAWSGITEKGGSDDENGGSSDDGEESEEGGWDKVQEAKERAGEDSSSDDDEDDMPPVSKRQKTDSAKPVSKSLLTKLEDRKPSTSKAAQVWFGQDLFKGVADLDNIEDDVADTTEDVDMDEDASDETGPENVWEDDDDDDNSFEVVPKEDDDTEMWDVEDENEDEKRDQKIQKLGLVTAEAVTLAQKLVNRQTTKTHLINDGFNRYSLNSKEGLPSWFLDDEQKYYKPNLPITKEAVNMLREKQRALDARPIKKVAEAKARKKMRAVQRLEKAVKKAGEVNESGDMNEKEKAGAIQKLLAKGMSKGKKKKNDVKVVVAKGSHKGLKGRPKGVKGRYTMVDSRMKKEVRAKKRKEKANKKRKRV